MNGPAVRAIYSFELARWFRTLVQSVLSPVISTSLYFVVFGSAIGAHMSSIEGVSYGAFIVPGLIMLSVLTESVSNASFGIYMPRYSGTIYEVFSAPISYLEIVIGYVGAAATKSVLLGLIILATARLFVPFTIDHPFWMLAFLLLTSLTFSLFGFVIGIWASGWEKLQVVPIMIITPLTFLGGSLLLDRHVAAVLAEGELVQPSRVLGQRLSLELLRHLRRQRRAQLEPDAGGDGHLARGRVVDLQDRLPDQSLSVRWPWQAVASGASFSAA